MSNEKVLNAGEARVWSGRGEVIVDIGIATYELVIFRVPNIGWDRDMNDFVLYNESNHYNGILPESCIVDWVE